MGLEVGAVGSRAFAATWRSEDDQVVATSFGGTMCWFPRKPGSLRIAREGFEHIVRCGACPGCVELDRRRLADRLSAKYDDHTLGLWLVRIKPEKGETTRLCHKLHRRPSLNLEPGLYRLGPASFAVIAREKGPITEALRALAVPHRCERIRLKRGRRAWRAITAGLLVSRDVYGAQVKRWYCRGLPPAERENWDVLSKPYRKGYSRTASPRAWTASKLVLVPPEVWKLGRRDRRTVRELLRKAPDPESATVVINLVAALSKKLAPQLSSIAAPQGRLTREQVVAWYRSMAEKKAASSSSGSGSEIIPPLSEVGGYVSSVHSTFAETPKLVSDDELLATGASGDPVWMERERDKERLQPQRQAEQRAKDQAAIKEWQAKMERLAKERDKGG